MTKKVTLQDIVQKRTGLRRGPFGGAIKKEFFVESGYKVYEQKNAIYKNTGLGKYYIDDKKFSELKAFEVLPGDFILSCSGTIGEIYQIPKEAPKGVINQALLRIRLDEEKIVPGYFLQLFRSAPVRAKIIDNSRGGAMQNLVSMAEFRKLAFDIPPLGEQKKIAQILSTWDEAIEAVEELIEKKKNQKKVLSEELFSGSRRLVKGSAKTQETKYGDIPADWNFLPISKVAKINKKSLGSNTQYKSYKYIDLSSVNEGVLSFPEKEIVYDELPSRARRIIQKGDVIFSTVRPNLLGYAIVDFDTSNHLCSTGFAVITPDVDSDTNFIYQQLYSNLFQRQVFSKVTGSNYPAINSTDFNNIKLNWPTDTNERKEIGDLLTSIELEVQLLHNKRKLLEKQKKGLMQQLLTSKTRIS